MSEILDRRPKALLIGCAIAVMAFGAAPAQAGCNSGNVANTDLLSSANCQADASGGNATAVGLNSAASGFQSTALGSFSSALGQNSTAAGVGSSATQNNDAAFGVGSTASGSASSAFGTSSTASGGGSSAFGEQSTASGVNGVATGIRATASGGDSTAVGGDSLANGNRSSSFGNSSLATGVSAVALGTGDSNPFDPLVNTFGARADNTTAAGFGATASARNATAIGFNSMASGASALAIGDGAQATGVSSIAIGQGVVASQTNQVVLGTSSHTYTAPGITSALSKSRQSGPLEFVTSDANGNLATDGGQFFSQLNNDLKRIDENQSGVALAMAIANPDLTGNERFGVAAHYGNFEGANALGAAMMGVLGHNFLTDNDRLAVSGGFGVGFSEGDGDDVFGGRVGLQWTR